MPTDLGEKDPESRRQCWPYIRGARVSLTEGRGRELGGEGRYVYKLEKRRE